MPRRAVAAREKDRIHWTLAHQDRAQLLSLIVRRIYTLRNQILHGGATWQSSANRDPLRDCTAFMQRLLPILIALMMDHPDSLWGDPYYPYVQAG